MKNEVVCLNLDKRINEQERLSREFSNIGINLKFFVVGDGSTLPANKYDYIDQPAPINRVGYPAWVHRPNSWNAFMAYKKIIQKAKDNNWPCVGLVEDDCHILDNFEEIAIAADNEFRDLNLPKWEMLYFCANHTWTPTTQVAPHILKVNGSGGFQFVFIRANLFDKFLDMPMICPIDEAAGRYIHRKHHCYAIWPNIARPLPGYSYCEGMTYDNTKLYENRGC